MYKTARIFFTLLIAALLLPACTRKQAPTPSDRGNSMGGGGLEGIIPDGPSDWGTDEDILTERGANGGSSMTNGKYGDKNMIEGLIPSVYFGFNSSSISSSERVKLQQAANHLNDNPADGLLIEGHCDWCGTAEYNIALGERRANSAKDYIITLGINPSRVEILSKGSLEATTGLEKDQSAQDRRTDLIILR
ncbi:MAG: OmpA family protein [Lentimonas sp.]